MSHVFGNTTVKASLRFLACRSLLVSMVAALPTFVIAGTEIEYQSLRAWCTQRNAHQNDEAWKAANNRKEYFHFHHYCFAMLVENKLYGVHDRQERRFLVDRILGETAYVIKNVKETHFLMPEVYAMRGRALFLGKRHVEAEEALGKALALDPNHVRASANLALLYLETHRRERAVDVVRAGLAVAPGNAQLRALGRDLNIELPSGMAPPEANDPASAQPESAPARVESTPIENAGNIEEKHPADPAVPERGCRFCPPEEIQSRWRESFEKTRKP